MKIKVITNVSASAVNAFIAPPDTPIGERGNVRVVEITDIPEGTINADVLRLWNSTVDASAWGNGGEYSRHTYRFSELGIGRMIR